MCLNGIFSGKLGSLAVPGRFATLSKKMCIGPIRITMACSGGREWGAPCQLPTCSVG